MRRVKLDRTDVRILRELQEDGRITNVALAQKVGISAPPCLRRVQALEESGFIRGYHADISPDKLGFGISVFTLVGLDSQSEADVHTFEKAIKNIPAVRECYLTTGEADFMLRVVTDDWESYQFFITQQLTSIPHVNHIKSSLVIRNAKNEAGVPITDDLAD